MHDVGVVAIGEPADRLKVVGKDRDSSRRRRGRGRLGCPRLGVVVADRRAYGAGQPVRRRAGEDVVAVDRMLEELRDPREPAGRRGPVSGSHDGLGEVLFPAYDATVKQIDCVCGHVVKGDDDDELWEQAQGNGTSELSVDRRASRSRRPDSLTPWSRGSVAEAN
jgi:hypothetical protein